MRAQKMSKEGDDNLDIPEFLLCPMTPEAKARLERVRAEYSNGPQINLATDDGRPRRDFLQPKGMSDEDWAAYKERTKVVKKEEATKTEKTAKTSRPSREGLVSIGQIAKDLGMIPREARGVLRERARRKPSCGWAWPANEVDAVKKAITEGKANAPKKEGKKASKKSKIPPPEETSWSAGKNGRRKWRKSDAKKAETENKKTAAAEKTAKDKAATAKKVAKIIGKKKPVKK